MKPTLYEKALTEAARYTENVDKLKHAMEVAEALPAEFPHLALDASVCLSVPCVLLNATGLTDLREIVPVLKRIVAQEFSIYRTYDEPDCNRRCYVYHDANGLDFTVFADLVRKGAKCEFIQVGVKEQPIYELKCK